ncbi:MAG TPA: ABC transporter substrate-binding protein [Terriglobales bacterium]|nr:ABC transporter substrate-binding protein [Terriglobales bacterium]
MKRICLVLAAALSFTDVSNAAARPHYGGTVRVEMRGSLSSFDIVPDVNGSRALLRDVLLRGVCDRMVTIDDNGSPRPSLAASWRWENEGRAWHFTLRDGVAMQNGTMLTPQIAANALSAQNPSWHVQVNAKDLIIQSETPISGILYELAKSRNSICIAGTDGRWIGSGPFAISDFRPGQYVDLQAFDDSWQGRPFVDRIHILMGRPLADQVNDFQLGRADVIEGDPTQPRPTSTSAAMFTRPIEVIALVFNANHASVADQKIRAAIAHAIDRNSIYSVLLRRQGEPSAALLPEWISGYAHLFNAPQDIGTAARLRNQVQSLAPLSLSYDSNDNLAQLIGERVSLNARDAGITLQARPESPMFRSFDADVRLVRVRIEASDPASALNSIGDIFDNAALQKADSTRSGDGLFTAENDVLRDYSIIPIAQIPEAFVLAPIVHDWKSGIAGDVDLGSLWIEATK